MSKKYIIEIEEEPLVRKSALHGEDAVYRAVGFKSLVFDKNGLDKLIPIECYTDSDKIKVGDEISYIDGIKCVAIDETENEGVWYILTENGVVEKANQRLLKNKTGRHFTEITEVLKKMRGDSD